MPLSQNFFVANMSFNAIHIKFTRKFPDLQYHLVEMTMCASIKIIIINIQVPE